MKTTELPVYQNSSGKPSFYQVPTFFLELMRIGPVIPSTFWKLTFVVWRGIIAPKRVPDTTDQFAPDWIFAITQKQFEDEYRINRSAVSDWTHAYEVSGLFRITYGKQNDGQKPTPTTWQYRTTASRRDWECFVVGLSHACKIHKDHHWKRQGHDLRPMTTKEFEESLSHDDIHDPVEVRVKKRIAKRRIYGDIAFQLTVATQTDDQRQRAGLSPVNIMFVENCIKLGYAKRCEDGSIEWIGARTARRQEEEMPSY